MAKDEFWVQLATRVPRALHREVRMHCVKADTKLMHFVVAAVAEKLKRDSGPRRRSA
jgi:hypothetical protein